MMALTLTGSLVLLPTCSVGGEEIRLACFESDRLRATRFSSGPHVEYIPSICETCHRGALLYTALMLSILT